jgi:cellulose 1,4-beta-cellobiosidase
MKRAILLVLLFVAASSLKAAPHPRAILLAKPAQTTASAGHSVVLTWTASTDTVSGYNVYRSTVSGAYNGAPLNGGTPVTATTYTDSSVTPGTYFYVVRSVIVSGSTQTESVNSNEAKAVLLPGPPTSLQVTSAN